MANLQIQIEGNTVDIDPEQAAKWDDSPVSVYLAGSELSEPFGPEDHKWYYLQQTGQSRTPACLDVLAMGKLPYPEVRDIMRFDAESGLRKPAFSTKSPWMGSSMLLRFCTPAQLMQQGFINLDPYESAISKRFEIDTAALRAIQDGMPLIPDGHGIHPVFHLNNWSDTTPELYEYLKPSLRIVTRLLEMEVVLDYLDALGKPWHPKETTPLYVKKGGSGLQPHAFFPRELTDGERNEVANEIWELQHHVKFKWEHLPASVGGLARAQAAGFRDSDGVETYVTGLRGYNGSMAAEVVMSYEWQMGLDHDHHYQPVFVPMTNYKSMLMRCQFHFAITLLHELVHAWTYNTRRDPPGWACEPFCADQRVGETGWAMINAIFGSVFGEIGNNPELRNSPFGLRSFRWPGFRHMDGHFEIEPYTATPAKHGITVATEYAVPMQFIRQFFTEEFYYTRVERFGPGILKTPKVLGVRCGWHPHEFDEIESPRVKRRKIGDEEVDDPEIASPVDDTLHPALLQGVLHKDWAFNLLGQPIDKHTGLIIQSHVPPALQQPLTVWNDTTSAAALPDPAYGDSFWATSMPFVIDDVEMEDTTTTSAAALPDQAYEDPFWAISAPSATDDVEMEDTTTTSPPRSSQQPSRQLKKLQRKFSNMQIRKPVKKLKKMGSKLKGAVLTGKSDSKHILPYEGT